MSYLKLVASETSPDSTAYAEAIEELDAGMCVFDRDGSVLANNQVFCRLLDLPPDWTSPKAAKRPVSAAEQLVSGWLARLGVDGNFTEIVALSSQLFVRVVGKALPSGGASLTLTEAADESVPIPNKTQQAASHRTQVESEVNFRTLLAHSPDSISLKDAEGRFVIVNKACEEILSQSAESMLGRTIWDILPDGDWHDSDASDAALLAGELMSSDDELPVDIPGRGRRVFRRTKFPVLDSDARPIGVGTVTTDVTEQIQAREKLRRNEAGFKNAQKLARMGNVERNFVTGEAYWSDGVFRIFDIDNRQTVPDFDEILEYVHPEDRIIYSDMLAAMRAGEASQGVDFRLVTPAGEVRYVHELLEADYDTDGHLIHCVAVIQDVTEERMAEQALRESEAKFHASSNRLDWALLWLAAMEGSSTSITNSPRCSALPETKCSAKALTP